MEFYIPHMARLGFSTSFSLIIVDLNVCRPLTPRALDFDRAPWKLRLGRALDSANMTAFDSFLAFCQNRLNGY